MSDTQQDESLTPRTILDFFPMEEAREKQAKALTFIQKAFDAGYRDVVIAAPTGIGKSAVGVAVCQWAEHASLEGEKGGYYLVTQKLLQDQLTKDFESGKFNGSGHTIKSAVEYKCPKFKNCAMGARATKPCPSRKDDTCQYQQEKAIFMSSLTAFTNYSYLFAEHKYANKLPKRKVIVLDECFFGHQEVITDNGPVPLEKIHEQVENRIPILVLSLHESGKFELKNVTKSWKRKTDKQIIKIQSGSREFECTENHPLLTLNGGWKNASAISPGDIIRSFNDRNALRFLNPDQLQIVIGSYLGDGGFDVRGSRARCIMTHGIAQDAYARWKGSVIGATFTPIEKNGYSLKPAVRAVSQTFVVPGKLESPKTKVFDWMIDSIGARGLAIWYMDDGNLSRKTNAQIATCSFVDQSKPKKILEKFGLKSSVNGKPGKEYLRLDRTSSNKFFNIIAKFVHPSMSYKLPPEFRAQFEDVSNREFECGHRVSKVGTSLRKDFVYDIEVEDNHNFVGTWNLKGSVCGKTCNSTFVAHNCHNLERQLLRFNDLKVGPENVKKFALDIPRIPKLKNLQEFMAWLETIYKPEVKAKSDDMANLASEHQDDDFAKTAVDLDQHLCKMNRAMDLIKKNRDNWVFWSEENKEGGVDYIARPLDAAPFLPELVKEMGTMRVYMSAFPGTKEVFCRSLGLPEEKVAWLNLRSSFEPKNRPIIMGAVGSMSMRNIEATLPSFLRITKTILDLHGNEKGVLHCGSYKLGAAIVNHFKGTGHEFRLLFPKSADEREKAYINHTTSPSPTVLVSPSMTEGFDFMGDLATWQIIAKCLDSETTALTPSGLKCVDDLKIGDTVIGLEKDGSVVYTKIIRKIKFDYDGPMLRFVSRSLSMLVTPDHRVLVKNKIGDLEYVLAKEKSLHTRAVTIPCSGNWKKNGEEYTNLSGFIYDSDILVLACSKFRHPSRKFRFLKHDPNRARWTFLGRRRLSEVEKIGKVFFQGRKQCKYSPIVFKTENLMRFLGWYVSEGWLSNGGKETTCNSIFICQIKNKHLPELFSLLEKMGLHFTRQGNKNFMIKSDLMFRFIQKHIPGKSGEKMLSKWILDQPKNLLEVFLDSAISGDGHRPGPNSRSYSTSSKILAEQMAEVGIKIGYSPVIHKIPKNGKTYFNVSFHGINGRTVPRKSIVQYQGKVWCLTTETGNFMASRDGTMFFTGNCPYPSLGDLQVCAKKDQDPDWYLLETAKVIIQACGRVCRSETDKGKTYILDQDAARLIQEHEHMFPKWFMEAVVWPKRKK